MLTILDLAHSRLEIVQGQVADLVLEVIEIHGAPIGKSEAWRTRSVWKKRRGRA